MRFGVNKTAVLGVLLLLCFFAGWADTSQLRGGSQESLLLTMHATATVLLVFLWYRQDAWELSYRRSWALNLGVLLVSVVALPWYLFRSRGAKGGVRAVAWLLTAFAAAMLAYRFGARFGASA